jgi:hypothetical protein
MAYINQYTWLDANLETFFDRLQVKPVYYKGCIQGIISCDGDKCEQYKYAWEDAGVPYVHGCAIYMLTKIAPFSDEVRYGMKTDGKFVSPSDWVINNYQRFIEFLPAA